MKLKEKSNTPKNKYTGPTKLPTCNCHTALLDEETVNQQHKAGLENTPKPLPIYIYIYITDVKISHHSFSYYNK
jgi:hypothetical protein